MKSGYASRMKRSALADSARYRIAEYSISRCAATIAEREDCAELKGAAPALPLPHSTSACRDCRAEIMKSRKSDVRGRIDLLLELRSALRTRALGIIRYIDIMHNNDNHASHASLFPRSFLGIDPIEDEIARWQLRPKTVLRQRYRLDG